MKWTIDKMMSADMAHGPETLKSDTYRLSIPKVGDKSGNRLDVPGWMVGDIEMAETMILAAKVIRKRLGVA